MGLLNMFSDQEDPQSQAQMAAAMALLQAGGPSRTPISLGQALGGAMQSYQNTLQSAKDRQWQQNARRNRMDIESSRLSYPLQLTSQPTAVPALPNNQGAWLCSFQTDPDKSCISGGKFFPNRHAFLNNALMESSADGSK